MTGVAKQELVRIGGELRASANIILETEPGSTVAAGMVTWAERLEKAAGVEPRVHLAVVHPIR